MIIIDNQYFPTINYYYTLLNYSNVEIVEYEFFKKSTFRNRCIIAGSSGPVILSVPLKNGRNQKAPFKDVEISYSEDWQRIHWRSILACYSRSPFFEFYEKSLFELFNLKEKFLFDHNLLIQEKIGGILKINVPGLCFAPPHREELKLDLRDTFTPRNFRQFELPSEYIQVFGERTGFIPNLSILDILCNLGPETTNYLKAKN